MIAREPITCTILQYFDGKINYPAVMFRCMEHQRACFGFPDLFDPETKEEQFICPVCSHSWNDLEPFYFARFEVQEKNTDKFYTVDTADNSLLPIMGMSVDHYLNIGEIIGNDRLGYLTRKYFENSDFNIILNDSKIFSIFLPQGSILTFSKWLQMQDEYDDFQLYTNSKFYGNDDDDDFVGNE